MIIYFLHVPRTGGNSFGQWALAGKRKKLFDAHWNGHSGYNKKLHEEFKQKDKTIVVTILRDPVEIAASMYAYIRSARNHGHYAEARKWGFSDWIEKSKCHKNLLSRFFFNPWTPLVEPPIEESIKTIQNVDYILDTSQLTQNVNDMCRKEGIKHNFNVHINARNKPPVSPKDVEIIKRVCSVDYEFLVRAAPHIKLKY